MGTYNIYVDSLEVLVTNRRTSYVPCEVVDSIGTGKLVLAQNQTLAHCNTQILN